MDKRTGLVDLYREAWLRVEAERDAARAQIAEVLAALLDQNSSHRGRVYNARAILEGGN